MGVAQRQSKAITLEPKDHSPLSLGGGVSWITEASGTFSLRHPLAAPLRLHRNSTVLLSQLPGSCQRSRV